MKRNGIIFAGGSGTRLYPVIHAVLKHLLPTFGRWVGETLSETKEKQLWIPPRFAHGFVALPNWAEMLYKATDYYSSEHERCIRWDDPDLAIKWPIEIEPNLSVKDKEDMVFAAAAYFF